MADQGNIPKGDVVHALEAMGCIDTMLAQFGGVTGHVVFRLSGGLENMSRQEAEDWIRESDAEGFSRIRFILHIVADKGAVVELAAST